MACEEFYDFNHIQQYLGDSIIRYNGSPIYIRTIGQSPGAGEYTLRYCNLSQARDDAPDMKFCNFPNDAIDLTPAPLGLVNLTRGMVHVSRQPYRQWKIGLTPRNMVCQPVFVTGDKSGREYRAIPYSEHMEDTINGKFPSLAEILSHDHPLGAFSRRFGVLEDQLTYRTHKNVGKIINGEPVLLDKFFYLKEVLTEDLNAQGAHYIAAGRAA